MNNINNISVAEKNVNLFNWDVVSKPLYRNDNKSIIKTIKIEDYFALYKKNVVSDTINEEDLICVHKNTYNVLNNFKLSKIANNLSRLTGMKIHGVSEYNDGKYVMVFLENNLHINISGFPMKTYLTILNKFKPRTIFNLAAETHVLDQIEENLDREMDPKDWNWEAISKFANAI